MSKILNRSLDIYVNSNGTKSLAVNGTTVIDASGKVVNIKSATVSGAMLTAKKGYFTIAIATNGTTPVDVFGSGGAPVALTVTNVVSNAQDTTAGNISLSQAANTVVTIAKGTTAGALVGGVSLAHTTYAAADACQVVSSSAGNSIVQITFQIA